MLFLLVFLLALFQVSAFGDDVSQDSIAEGEEDSFAAAVDNVKPEVWRSSKQISASARTLDNDSFRPGSKDVCSIM